MAWALTQSGFSHDLARAMAAVPGGKTGFLLISVVAFIVLGSLLEGIPAIVLFGPLLFPIAHQFGIHEVHYYSMIVILAMDLASSPRPSALCYYAACIIGGVAPRPGCGGSGSISARCSSGSWCSPSCRGSRSGSYERSGGFLRK